MSGYSDRIFDLLRRGGNAAGTGSQIAYSLGYSRSRRQPLIQPNEQRLITALSEPPLVVRRRDGEEIAGAQVTTAGVARRLIDLGDDEDPLQYLAAASVVDALQVGYGLLECPLWPPRPAAGSGANARGERWRYIPTNDAQGDTTRGVNAAGQRVALSMREPSVYWLESERWNPDEVVKLRFDRDPDEAWHGRGALDSLGQVIFAEFHQLQLQAAAVANAPYGYLGVIKPKQESQFRRVARRIRQSVTGRNRGSLSMTDEGFDDLKQLEFDPNHVRFNELQLSHEAYADQSLGIPAPIAGGLLGMSAATYDNYRMARQVFYRERLRPLWRMTGEMLTKQWLHRYIDADPQLEVAYDLSDIAGLQEDRTEAAARIHTGYAGSAATLNQYVEAMGLPSYGARGNVLKIGQDFIPVDDVLGPDPDGKA
ncbi:MAG: phage portal protein [Acidobacteria bacterium]|nr:phage portal protein [Acidobacteriota bacterium]